VVAEAAHDPRRTVQCRRGWLLDGTRQQHITGERAAAGGGNTK
jgi:hypothetical protein